MKSWNDVNPHQFDSLHNSCKQNIFFAFHEVFYTKKKFLQHSCFLLSNCFNPLFLSQAIHTILEL
jgi:hypothetical protein